MHLVFLNYLLYIYLLSIDFSYYGMLNSNTTGVTCGAENVDPTITPKFTFAF